MYPYDVAKAKQILDDAGWKVGSGGIRSKDGKPLKIRHITTAGRIHSEVGRVHPGVAAGDRLRLRRRRDAVRGDGQAVRRQRVRGVPPLLRADRSARRVLPGVPLTQIEGAASSTDLIKDPKLDALIEQGGREQDLQKRMAIYQEQKTVMENAWILPNFDTALVHMLQKRVKGFKVDLLGGRTCRTSGRTPEGARAMWAYIQRRLITMVLVLLGVSLVVFLMLHFLPRSG